MNPKKCVHNTTYSDEPPYVAGTSLYAVNTCRMAWIHSRRPNILECFLKKVIFPRKYIHILKKDKKGI